MPQSNWHEEGKSGIFLLKPVFPSYSRTDPLHHAISAWHGQKSTSWKPIVPSSSAAWLSIDPTRNAAYLWSWASFLGTFWIQDVFPSDTLTKLACWSERQQCPSSGRPWSLLIKVYNLISTQESSSTDISGGPMIRFPTTQDSTRRQVEPLGKNQNIVFSGPAVQHLGT